MKVANRIIGLAVLAATQLVYSQNPGQNQGPALAIGENMKMNAGADIVAGYSAAYGDVGPSDHALNFGFDGKVNGYYYNPQFLSFSLTPYYNQSRANSTSQSLTGASGIDGTANFFSGSHFPGSASYRYDRDTSGTFGLAGQPNFTTIGKGQSFGVNWSALLPNMPTLSVGYSQGEGSGTIYGTDEQTHSTMHLFNLNSNYLIAGFRLNAFYTRNSNDSKFPEFLAGQQASEQDSSGQNIGAGAQHNLPLHGQFYANYNRSSSDSNYASNAGQNNNAYSYTDDTESAGASFNPTQKLTLNVTENYTSNLSGYLSQILGVGATPAINFGSGAHSLTMGGGASYQITNYLTSSAQATHYDQSYFGQTYTGTYLSGTLAYGKRLLDMFTLSASVVDSNNAQGNNEIGFVGNVNFFRKIFGFSTSGNFSYAQNVQSILVTYTTSYYQYSANLHRRFPRGIAWTAAFGGSHSGLTNYQGTNNHSESYSTSLSMRQFTLSGVYTASNGISVLGASGLVPVTSTPGVNDAIVFGGSSYGGGFSLTPVRRLVISGNFNRAISDTMGQSISHNNMEIYNAQLQYHLRKIGLQAGYTRFTQGVSAVGAPANSTAYFVGVSRWFDFF